jgi:hypothetical protein
MRTGPQPQSRCATTETNTSPREICTAHVRGAVTHADARVRAVHYARRATATARLPNDRHDGQARVGVGALWALGATAVRRRGEDGGGEGTSKGGGGEGDAGEA